MFEITEEVLSPQKVAAMVIDETVGAVVTFVGTVRRHSKGKVIRYLEYDVYPEMAEKKMKEIGAEIKERWGLDNVTIVHRIGRLEIGEASVVIAVGSPHRKEAFAACEYAINRIKQTVPIWKKEVAEDGEAWVEGELLVR